MKPPPGLSRVEEEEEENEQLEDLAPGPSESLTVQDLLQNDGSDRAPAETVHEPPDVGENAPKKARIDPHASATEPVQQTNEDLRQCTMSLLERFNHANGLRRLLELRKSLEKMEPRIDVEVNADEGEIEQELRLAEPLLWESEFPPEAEKKGMMKEMNPMKDFDVYDEVLVKDCTDEQVNEALDCRMGQSLEK